MATAKPFGGHEVGKTYHCAYWGRKYTVLEAQNVDDWRGWEVTVQWEDGHQTTHCTPLDKRDREV